MIDQTGRGPTARQLLIAGAAGLVVFALALGFLMGRYTGSFGSKIAVVAQLTNVGDGLPQGSAVKFRGMQIGEVTDVSVAAVGTEQSVHIDLDPEFAGKIPANVTARVVPDNLFAVAGVELVFNGGDREFLHAGSRIAQDHGAGTITLQHTLTSVRGVLDKIDPMQFGRVLGTLSYALDGSGRLPGSTLERVDRWLREVSAATPDTPGLLDDLAASMRALNQSAPDLIGVLANSVESARTVADRRGQLVALLTGSTSTVGTVQDLFARNPDVGKEVTAGTSDTFGGLAADPDSVTRAIANLNDSTRRLKTTFTWGPQHQQVWNAGISFTPWEPNTVADCPRYGALTGPSCGNAPAVPDYGYLPESMRPHRLDAAAGLPPPAPVAPGNPLPHSGPDPFAGTPLQGLFPAALAQPGGTIALSGDAAQIALLGRRPNAAEYLLLATILRGGTVQVSPGEGK
ncbi:MULTISPECIES: MlaD family protein [unclassified Nocardia]|uniref:MlaD family protein n=1 Tax=unclassified Nocardia TaxID=2637762 RepID=UPI001CE44339|nr:MULTISPECIES: MCE family protein [unclassified Nocardia]